VVAATAGTGTWLAYLIATIGILFVAGNIGVLARSHPMAGSYFVDISRTLGPLVGMTAGWSMIAAYAATAITGITRRRIMPSQRRPAYPYNLLPYLFASFLACGAAWYAIVAARTPNALLAIQRDLEL
jgi:amino acid transporter